MTYFKQCMALTLIFTGLGSGFCAAADRSLVFRDSHPDAMDFLATRSPSLVGESKKLLPISDISAYSSGGKTQDLRKVVVPLAIDALEMEVSKAERIGRITNPELVPTLEIYSHDRAALRGNPEGLSFEKFLGARLASPDRTIADDIMLAALQVYHYAQGSPAVFLGRTPCLVQVAYEELLRQKGVSHPFYHLSFSGTPDTMTLRTAEDYRVEEKNILRNLVTPERLSFFETLMTEKGLSRVTGKIYLVDMISTGGSLNSFLRLLRHYYTQTLRQEMPDVEFLGIGLSCNPDHGFQGVWRYTKGTLRFNEDSTHGIRPLMVRTKPIVLSPFTVARVLDNDVFQCMVHGVELPAQRWTEASRDALLRGGELHQELYRQARPHFEAAAVRYNKEYDVWKRLQTLAKSKG